MLIKIFYFVSKFIPTEVAYAHCDIPCGIYDPHAAQIGAHTVIRMTQLLDEIKTNGDTKTMHDIARLTRVKEDHSELVERELDTLKNDYFKEEHFKRFSELNQLIVDGLKVSSKTRQAIDMESAEQLLELVLRISEIFYKTKGLYPVRVKSPYPTGREIVVYK